MKNKSKKIIESLLYSLAAGTAEYSIIENDLKRVLFMESVSESNKFNMYAYCFKDDLCPYYNGVYHDANYEYEKGKFVSTYHKKYLGTSDDEKELFFKYKLHKEQDLHYLAEKYKGQIKDNVYHALINYRIEEGD